ncbi:MAG: hydroxymethylbilane synthase [Planctomycetota bacterium]
MRQPLLIGTRASHLALWQAHWVADRLGDLGATAAMVEVTTRGDTEQSDPVASIGVQGVFTKEVQRAVLSGDADLAVHSLKDLPTEPTPGLVLAAIPEREDFRDALVSRSGAGLDDLPEGARVGTGSQRRRALLAAVRPDLQLSPIRGNVDTRLAKLDRGEYDAIVLASAGLKRLGLHERIAEVLAPPRLLPAPGQGALGIECRADDDATRTVLGQLDHVATRSGVEAERALLAQLHGGCSVPVGAWGRTEGDALQLDAVVASTDGIRVLRAADSGDPSNPAAVGRRLGDQLLADGAAAIIDSCR